MSLNTLGAVSSAPFVFPVQWIKNDKELADACAVWQKKSAIALDTEFERVKTFWPVLALIQLCDGDTVYLIDPLKITQWQPFATVLEAPAITKVMHAAGEDLEAFAHTCDAKVAPLFDTQLAIAFAGLGSSVGLASVVRERYGVELAKDTARTDWLARPLTEEQVNYAVTDVLYLLDLYERLLSLLEQENRTALVFKEGEQALEKVQFEEPLPFLYRRLKQSHLLRAQALVIAQDLALWREALAREQDISRNHLIKDDQIVQLSLQPPSSWNALAEVSLHPKILRLYGKDILEVIARARVKPNKEWPNPVSRIVDVKDGRKLQDVLLTAVQAFGAKESIPAELIYSKRALETLILAVADNIPYAPFIWRGWRKDRLHAEFGKIFSISEYELPSWW